MDSQIDLQKLVNSYDIDNLILMSKEFLTRLEPRLNRINDEVADSITISLRETIGTRGNVAYIEEIPEGSESLIKRTQYKSSQNSLSNSMRKESTTDESIDKPLNLVNELSKKDMPTLIFLSILVIGIIVLMSIFKKK